LLSKLGVIPPNVLLCKTKHGGLSPVKTGIQIVNEYWIPANDLRE